MKKTLKSLSVIILMVFMIGATGCMKDKTPDYSGSLDGHDYIDLGLPSGTLWASCNIGAATPESCGWWFSWGETQPKEHGFSVASYKYMEGDFYHCQITKYNRDDGLVVLLPEDDAATVNWGDGWHTPTVEQWSELLQYTKNGRAFQNGENGWRFTSVSNGNSIFLPAAGHVSSFHEGEDFISSIGTAGWYSSSTLCDTLPGFAYACLFNSESVFLTKDYRFASGSIRPVRSE